MVTSFITEKELEPTAILDPPFWIVYLRQVSIKEFLTRNFLWV